MVLVKDNHWLINIGRVAVAGLHSFKEEGFTYITCTSNNTFLGTEVSYKVQHE